MEILADLQLDSFLAWSYFQDLQTLWENVTSKFSITSELQIFPWEKYKKPHFKRHFRGRFKYFWKVSACIVWPDFFSEVICMLDIHCEKKFRGKFRLLLSYKFSPAKSTKNCSSNCIFEDSLNISEKSVRVSFALVFF